MAVDTGAQYNQDLKLDVSAAWGKAGVCVCMCVYACARTSRVMEIFKLGSDGCRALLSTLKGWPLAVPWWSRVWDSGLPLL